MRHDWAATAGGAGRARGFTLVELLLVVILLAILAVIAAPRVGALLAGGNVRTGAREIASAGRYARKMALLNQTPVDLTIVQGSGKFRITAIEAAEATSFGISDLAAYTNETGYTQSLLDTSARRRASLSGGFGLAVARGELEDAAWRGGDSATNVLEMLRDEEGNAPEDTVSLADSINLDREAGGVKFWFEGYTDRVESRSAYSRVIHDDFAQREGTDVNIRYRANGTVRPYRIAVRNPEAEDDVLYVVVNSVGTSKITDGEGD